MIDKGWTRILPIALIPFVVNVFAFSTDAEKMDSCVNQFRSMNVVDQYPTLIHFLYDYHTLGSTFKPKMSSRSSTQSGNSGAAAGNTLFYETSGLKDVLGTLIKDQPKTLSLLDVGGGNGAVGAALQKWFPFTSIDYSCIDVYSPTGVCTFFNGRNLSLFNDSSQDVVIFHYVLHHAKDGEPISLLRDAHRVTRKTVIVGEDMAATTPERALRNFAHETSGIFRGPEEWRQLFRLLGFNVLKEVPARWDSVCSEGESSTISNDLLKLVGGPVELDFFCQTEVKHRAWALEKIE